MGRLRTLLEKFSAALGMRAGMSRGRDYQVLSSYILKINKVRDIDRVLFEASRCLRELLDYELLAFALRKGRSLDIWVDPRIKDGSIVNTVKKDFYCQDIDPEIHYFSEGPAGGRGISWAAGDLLSYPVLDERFGLRLYVMPRGKVLPRHEEIVKAVGLSLGCAVRNELDMRKLEAEAAVDPLTGCYNRRTFSRYIEHEIALARRQGGHFSLIMLDLDHFKRINDRFGHDAGDMVLREIAALVASAIRKSDYLVRYGGEEFVVALPGMKLTEALCLAERLRKLIAYHPFRLGSGILVKVTSSFGVSTLKDGDDKQALFKEADEMLYQAKVERNTVMPEPRIYAGRMAAALQ